MDPKREIEGCCSGGERDEFAVGCEYVYLVGKEVELEFVNEADGVGFAAFEDFPNLPQPRINFVASFRGEGFGAFWGLMDGSLSRDPPSVL